MYKLENAADALAQRLVKGIARNSTGGYNMGDPHIEALVKSARDEALAFAAAIRETIIAEIAAAKAEK